LFPSASLYHNCLLSQYPCPYYQFLYKSTFSAQTTMFKVSIVNYLFKSQIVLPKFVFRFQVSPLKRSFLNPEIPFYTQKLWMHTTNFPFKPGIPLFIPNLLFTP
jgi:hypothetical protein